MEQNQSFLAEEKVGKLMLEYAIPCIISLLVGALYNIVDQIFIANAGYLGSCGNAANTVVFPLTVIALAIAVMIGDGCCAFSSISIGKNKSEDAAESVGNSVVLTVSASLILTVIYLVFADKIIALFGGTVNAETFKHSSEYFFWISLGIPFYMFGQAMGKAVSSTMLSMVREIVFGVGFAILLPVFFGLDGVLYSMPVSDVLTAVISTAVIIKTYRELSQNKKIKC